MVIFFSIIAGISAVALVLLFIRFVNLARSGSNINHRGVWVVASWICLILLVGSAGGAVFSAVSSQTSQPKQTTKTVSKEKPEHQAAAPKLSFSPTEPIIYSQSVPVQFTLSAKTQLKIVGYYSKITYHQFAATDQRRTVTYDFDEAGYYELIATRGSKKVTKHITVTKPAESSSSTVNTQSESATPTM